jgi:hypothetical protein
MVEIIDAERYIGRIEGGVWGPANGIRLANAVLKMANVPWEQIVIDTRGCEIQLLHALVFDDFWQRLYDEQPQRLEQAKAIRWELASETCRRCFNRMLACFKPAATPPPARNYGRRLADS